jgi:hypothetical protein
MNKKTLRKWDAFIVNFIVSRKKSRRQNSNINTEVQSTRVRVRSCGQIFED